MSAQVVGGGVIVLIAVLLWMVYLLPTWHSRRQFDSAERNAVRLNQALRVLAETSETPQEVRVELTARTAMAQQKLARRALAERESAALEGARTDLERARDERAAARLAPDVRRARARRRTRLVLTVSAVAALGFTAYGAWQAVTTGVQLVLWCSLGVAVFAGLLLQRMTRVGARAVRRENGAATAPRVARDVQDVALVIEPQRDWQPRELPKPLSVSAGSRASAVLDAAEARDALRRAALEESMRQQVADQQPPSIDNVRVARAESPYDRMGRIDDAEIEAHVRELLRSRAAS